MRTVSAQDFGWIDSICVRLESGSGRGLDRTHENVFLYCEGKCREGAPIREDVADFEDAVFGEVGKLQLGRFPDPSGKSTRQIRG